MIKTAQMARIVAIEEKLKNAGVLKKHNIIIQNIITQNILEQDASSSVYFDSMPILRIELYASSFTTPSKILQIPVTNYNLDLLEEGLVNLLNSL